MATTPKKPKLIVIVGPTASGKSDLAMWLARQYDGEIIAGDSRTIYKGMDIGTAKPSTEDQQLVPHWGIDLVEPGKRFTAYQFKSYAKAKVTELQGRGKMPIIVGGSGLYIDSFLFDFGFREDADLKQRAKLEKLEVQELQEIIEERGYAMPSNNQNKRHLIRTIETKDQKSDRNLKIPVGIWLIGILPPDELIKQRINDRVEASFKKGIVKEAEQLSQVYGREAIMQSAGIAYKVCLELLDKTLSESTAKSLIKTKEWQYARRQKTWFKRNQNILWFDSAVEAQNRLSKLLNT